MSPEQCNGSPLDGRSELFAIGVMLWEALANDTLFKGTPSECVAQIMVESIPLPSTLRSRIPGELESIAMQLLERERDARVPNAEAAIEALVQCKDAPRNGRDDLARLIAQRFPDAQARRSGGASGQPPTRARGATIYRTESTDEAWWCGFAVVGSARISPWPVRCDSIRRGCGGRRDVRRGCEEAHDNGTDANCRRCENPGYKRELQEIVVEDGKTTEVVVKLVGAPVETHHREEPERPSRILPAIIAGGRRRRGRGNVRLVHRV